jgi:hypothetical protein
LELGAGADPGWWKSVTDHNRFDEDHMYSVCKTILINASDDEMTLRSRALGDAARRQELACDYICTGVMCDIKRASRDEGDRGMT